MTELATVVDPGQLARLLDITIDEAGPGRAEGSMRVEGNTQTYGLLHGGASCVLAETLASVAACHHFAARGGVAVGVDINATHHAAVRGGRVTGVAKALHLGRTLASYEVVISDERGKRVCTARMTAAYRTIPVTATDTDR